MKFISFFDPKQEIDFVGKFRAAVAIAIIIPAVAVIGLFTYGINMGIDFTGGTELQVKFEKSVEAEQLHDVMDGMGFKKTQIQRYGASSNNEWLIRVERLDTFSETDLAKIKTLVGNSFKQKSDKGVEILFNPEVADRIELTLDEGSIKNRDTSGLAKLLDTKSGFQLRRTKSIGEAAATIDEAINSDEPENGRVTYTVQFMGISDKIGLALTKSFGQSEIRKVEYVDSQVSKQLRTDGVLAVVYALLAMLVYIAIRFDLLFSPGAILGLVHDTLGALLVFVLFRYEFDLPSVAALLTIVGYSINSTIVIYDRIREIVPPIGGQKDISFDKLKSLVNKAVNDTLSRTINTSITTLFATVSLAVLGGGVIASFALALSFGIVLGAFASTFIAPATYLFLRKHYAHLLVSSGKSGGITRAERERGIV